MPKLIPSVAHLESRLLAAECLREEAERREAEKDRKIRALEAQIARLTGTNPPKGGKSQHDATISILSLSNSDLPSYMRSTKATDARRAVVERNLPDDPEETSGHEASPLYHDGALIARPKVEGAHFLRMTMAFERRRRYLITKYHKAYQQSAEDTEDEKLEEPALEHCSTKTWNPFLEEPQPQCMKCRWRESCLEHTGDGSLRVRSRLGDSSFYELPVPASKCAVPMVVQTRMLKKALGLAQEALWHELADHWPSVQGRLFPEGPEEIRFGFAELEATLAREEFRQNTEKKCRRPPCPYGIIDLRNCVAHPRAKQTRVIDELIRDAQELAVYLCDEKRAFSLRRMRDELAAEAVKTFEHIEAFVDLVHLPYADPWHIHIQRMFFGVHQADIKIPEVIRRAARNWKWYECAPGAGDPSYLARREKAAAFMRPSPPDGVEQERSLVASPLIPEYPMVSSRSKELEAFASVRASMEKRRRSIVSARSVIVPTERPTYLGGRRASVGDPRRTEGWPKGWEHRLPPLPNEKPHIQPIVELPPTPPSTPDRIIGRNTEADEDGW